MNNVKCTGVLILSLVLASCASRFSANNYFKKFESPVTEKNYETICSTVTTSEIDEMQCIAYATVYAIIRNVCVDQELFDRCMQLNKNLWNSHVNLRMTQANALQFYSKQKLDEKVVFGSLTKEASLFEIQCIENEQVLRCNTQN